MKKYQNGNSRKFLPPPSDVAPVKLAEEEKKQQGAKSFPRKTSGGLRIFFESKNLNSEPRFEWSLQSEKKKYQKDATRKMPAEEKRKKYVEKKNQIKTFNSLGFLQNHAMKAKSEAPNKLHSTPETQNINRGRFSENIGKTNEPENLKAPVNSLFTLRKENLDPGKKTDEAKALQDSTLVQKLTEKTESCEKCNQYLEVGKKKINNILKMHAQKFQTCSTKSNQHLKDSFQGVTELLKKVQNFPNNKENVDDKKTAETGVKKEKANEKETNEGKKEKKTEEKEIKTETGKERTMVKETPQAEETAEETKKLPLSLLKLPQSNELERRLQPTGKKSESLFPNDKEINVGEVEEDKISKSENTSEEEKKSSKNITYTDRLILLKMSGRDDEKKSKSCAENDAESKAKVGIPERLELLSRILSVEHNPKSQTSLLPKECTKEVFSTRDTEHVIKTKSSRSTELRDLVTQAIKEHKIFCIFDNHSYIVRPVREELLSRGWLEVIPDRRLIPRRRPPPMGPTTDREKLNFDRNCNTIEAILSAKETFADEIRASVSKSASFKTVLEGLRLSSSPGLIVCRKPSQDSLSETLSFFRIIPPTPEKKKNNAEIREFVNKYGALLEKDASKFREKKLKEREKYCKPGKKEMSKTPQSIVVDPSKNQKNNNESTEQSSNGVQSAADDKNATLAEDDKYSMGILYDSSIKGKAGKPDQKKSQQKLKKQEEPAHKILYTESETKTISKMLQSMNARIHFMWLSIKPGIHLKCFNYSPEIINKFQKTSFCTKIGLWSHLNNIQWYAHEVHFPAKSPRMYNTGEADDLQAFFQDFQLTACIGMLKWLSETFFDRGMKAVQTKKGKVPLKAFEFAIKQCEKYIRFKDNEDLSVLDEQKILQDEWNNFLQWFYVITNDHGKLQESSSAQLMVVYTKAVETLKLMKRYWPEMDIDGRLNIWIMKPYCASCGRGIFMTNNVYYIGQHSKYIIQKYIEKPLLIYNTKFDIRQWFMITKLTPLEIWMYRECYLRFCTQPFALRNLHESVHLSNNSVQRKYVSVRDSSLPDQNMWDSKTFQLYLRTIGHPNAWDEIIYPGMKDAIISTMLAAQDTFDGPRKSWFEVYGADFMISANVKDGPWLIEINENPAMDPSTKVTARLCPQMLRDVIKVVVDKRANKNASTGEWELIYRQNYSPSFGSVDLDVRGKKIARMPYNTKPTVNTINTPSTPVRPAQDPKLLLDCDTNKLYEIVKSLGEVSNSRGDVSDTKKSCEKMMSLKSMKKKLAVLPNCVKNDPKTTLQSLMVMIENKPQGRDKKEDNMAHKIIAKTVELSRTPVSESKNSVKKSEKNLASVVSMGSLKRVRNGALTTEPLMRSSMRRNATEIKGNASTSESLFPGGEKKLTGDQKFLPSDKYKFSKF